MEEDTNVRILVELINSKDTTQFKNIMARNPSVQSCILTEDFTEKMGYITRWRYHIVFRRWSSFFDDCWKKMLSSHKMYLTFVMYACISEQRHHQNIFDRFISVCMLVDFLNQDIFYKTGLNFSSLKSDVFMVYYQNELKFLFNKHGGFQQLVEFILSHRVNKKKCNKKKSLLPDMDIPDEFREEMLRYEIERTNPETVSNDLRSIYLANLVLSIPSIALPSLPSYPDLVMILVAHRKNEAKIMIEKLKDFNADSVSIPKCINSDRNKNTLIVPDKTDPVSKEMELSKKLVEELISNPVLQNFLNEMQTPMAEIAIHSDQASPSTPSVEIIPLSNELDPPARQVASEIPNEIHTHMDANALHSDQTALTNEHDPIERKVASKEIPRTAARDTGIKATLTSEISKAASHGSSSSISDSEQNYDPGHQDNLEQCENIIQAVIRYNHSKILSNENSNSRIQMDEEVGGVLEHLKDSIKYLIEVLDKHGNK